MSKSFIPFSSFLIAMISTTILFVVTALMSLLILLERPLIAHLHADVWQLIELHDDRDVDQIIKILRSDPQIDDTTIVFRNGAMAAEFMEQETGISFELDGENPFSNVLSFSTEAIYDPDLGPTVEKIRRFSSVKDIYVQTGYIRSLKEHFNLWKKVLIVLSLVIFVLAITILSGLFRLILFAERRKIKTMELVGATSSTIVWPFLVRFTSIGLVAMMLASAVLFLLAWRLIGLQQMRELLDMDLRAIALVILVWLVILVCILCISYWSITRFSSKEMEDL